MSKFMLLFISIMVIAIIPLESFGETIEINGEKYTIIPVKDHTEPKVTCANDKPLYHECHKLNGYCEHSHCDNHYPVTPTPLLGILVLVLFVILMMFTALIIYR